MGEFGHPSINPLNRHTLWNHFIASINNPDVNSNFVIHGKNAVKDKIGNNIFNKEEVTPQLKKVVEWYAKKTSCHV
ncbi:MAG: hypothetical protein Q8L78_04370 [Coxiellaceae bacterium]|nr:hypothetical protein [Coxiellaceae bacterium]